MAEIEKLADFSEAPPPAVTRILYSKEDQASRKWLKTLMKEVGLLVREDGLGNLFARWEGSEPDLPAVATGSHTDAIPFSGKYDGVVGVLGAIEAFRALRKSGFQARRSLEIIHFTAEEPTRFGIGCLGSRALAGLLNKADLLRLRDSEGRGLDALRSAAGYSLPLEQTALPLNFYAGFVELHIEQGPRLEAEKLDIGVVSAIAAPAALRFTLEGEGGHAGAVLMPGRKDALIPAAKIIEEIERAALESDSSDSVATVGLMNLYPGAVNSIPSRVVFEADIRDVQLETRNGMIDRICAFAREICRQRDVRLKIETLNADAPCRSGDQLMEAIETACRRENFSHRRLISRAYHDTLFMSKICPTAMIFIPSKNGYSHRPEEYSSPEEIEKGVRVLAKTMAALSTL